MRVLGIETHAATLFGLFFFMFALVRLVPFFQDKSPAEQVLFIIFCCTFPYSIQ